MSLEQGLAGIAAYAELLKIAACAAANADSATHRAHACRDVDDLGLGWIAPLSTVRQLLADAIVGSIRALAGATNPEARTAIAEAIKRLVCAARSEPPLPRRAPAQPEPRTWWAVDRD